MNYYRLSDVQQTKLQKKDKRAGVTEEDEAGVKPPWEVPPFFSAMIQKYRP